jgi:hypothetical protein
MAGQQQPGDGSWGLGMDVWYLRLYYPVDHVKGGADNAKCSTAFSRPY